MKKLDAIVKSNDPKLIRIKLKYNYMVNDLIQKIYEGEEISSCYTIYAEDALALKKLFKLEGIDFYIINDDFDVYCDICVEVKEKTVDKVLTRMRKK